jgi:hypothetical protein
MPVLYECFVLAFLFILLYGLCEEPRRRGIRIVKGRNLNSPENPYVSDRRNGGKFLILGMGLQ